MSKTSTEWIEDGAVTKAKLNADVAGVGISGAAGSPLDLDVHDLAEVTTTEAADEIAIYDDSVGGVRKI